MGNQFKFLIMMIDTITENKTLEQFSKYLTKECFTDVTLVSDDLWKFAAHRIILSAASPVLESLLMSCTQMNESHTIIPLRGYNRYEVQGLINFIYLKDTSKNALLDHRVKRLLNELKVNGFHKKETNPTVEKSFKSVNEIKKEFEILSASNIAIDTITPAEPESDEVPEMSFSRKEDIESLSLKSKSLTVKRLEEKANSNAEAIVKI